MEPSGGTDKWDTFIHTAVPSRAVQAELHNLYAPLGYAYTLGYRSNWKPRLRPYMIRYNSDYDDDDNPCQGYPECVDEVTLSRWLSARIALNLVKRAEEARGMTYDKIYLTRPDMLLWVEVDLRRYCNDAVYYSNCYPPYHPGRPDGCPSDFHYVMTSEMARRMATLPEHLVRYRNWDNAYSNAAMRDFVRDIIGVDFKTDHVVIARHENIFRAETDYMGEANYYKCHPRLSTAPP